MGYTRARVMSSKRGIFADRRGGEYNKSSSVKGKERKEELHIYSQCRKTSFNAIH